jgi:hypothetical protein
MTLEPAVGQRSCKLEPSTGAGFRPVSATAEQFQMGESASGGKSLAHIAHWRHFAASTAVSRMTAVTALNGPKVRRRGVRLGRHFESHRPPQVTLGKAAPAAPRRKASGRCRRGTPRRECGPQFGTLDKWPEFEACAQRLTARLGLYAPGADQRLAPERGRSASLTSNVGPQGAALSGRPWRETALAPKRGARPLGRAGFQVESMGPNCHEHRAFMAPDPARAACGRACAG